MSALPMRIDKEAGRTLTPLEIFDIHGAPRDQAVPTADALYQYRPRVASEGKSISAASRDAMRPSEE